MGSQQPPGSPLSREEGEAPPPAPAPEGRRRSRRVRLRGSCRHRPTFLGHRDLASSASAGPASVSSEIMASAAKEFKMDNFSPKAGTSKLQQAVPADASPDSKCPICLDRFDNVSYLDRCLHKFCFRCVQEWSKNKAECPLCKQPFDSIFHSVRAEDDFKEYVLRPSYNGSFATPDRRFRYRTTMTRERSSSIYSPTTTVNRRTTTPPDSGVLFEGLGISRSRDVEIPPIMRQITIRGPSAADDRTLRKIQEQDIINFRRTLYRAGARVRNIEDGGRYRDISAEFFRRNPACLHRLVPWLKRELTVLFGAHGSLVNIVQHIIMSNVTRYDLESQAFVSDLRPFLLNRTEHFIHEFISFARSPFNMAAFDQHANYDCPAPSYEEGSHSDSSVITISPDETETQELDINVATVSQAPWDDETPGPSYSSSEQVHVAMSSLLNTSDSSDEELVTGGATSQNQGVQTNDDLHNDSDSSSDNCVIVGFVKPLAERTPELVELSSDSEELGSYDKMETVKSQEQEQSSSSGDSDVSRCSTPRSVLGKDEQMNKVHHDSGTRMKSKKEGKRSTSLSSSRDLSSSMREDRGCSPSNHRHRKRGRSRSSDSRSQSRSGHDQRNHRKHHGKKRMKSKRSRSRESSSRPRGRRDKKSSRTRDSSWSRRSQTLSLSSESTSRSRSRSSDHGKRRSRSRTRDRYYLRNNYGSRYKWEYTYYSRNKDRDGYESSYRRRTLSRAHYSRQSSSPEFRIQSFSERTNARKKNNHSERKYYYYERHRSRSLSSNRSRTASTGPDRVRNEKPGGKRKYKTRHLESTNEVAQQTHEFTPKVKDSHYQKPSKLDGSYKNESDSLSDGRSSDRETKHRRRKRRARSLSVEIVYEGKATDIAKHHKKKKKKHKKKHKKHHGDNTRSPVVITIDSDSDKDSEVKANTECDNGVPPEALQNEYLASSLESFETNKDVVTIEDEFTVLDKECDVSTLTDNLNNASRTVNNIPPQAAAEVEQTLDVREESIFASDLENQPINVSIHTEPSRQLPSPRTSLMSVSLGRDCDVS
ncbi:E3 ubiquitin-protein ligase Topors isoform X2 [Dipodomys spectabilis]|uniref:E3 ubiquitin-protein ligase Topors isoform X2 n=1 Tax=Dipodomys spectabilis TaxID=105255 RepID=UPI001C53EACD|nr:E3 ubiquitin-protein ligase Topors isoform X2 [Dipodomys spectabilis]